MYVFVFYKGPPEPCAHVSWRGPEEGLCMPGYNLDKIFHISEDTCKARCAELYYCNSIDYVQSRTTCYLNSVASKGQSLGSDPEAVFYKKKCELCK